MHSDTLSRYNDIIKTCQAVFEKKTQDYGTAWRILRLPSMTDQIMIKAQRIRAIQEQRTQRVDEGIFTELIGIVNYSIMALMQIALKDHKSLELTYHELLPFYNEIVAATTALLFFLFYDYQEAWRAMRLSSIFVFILMKLLRNKRIEDFQRATLISEGVENYY